MTASKDEKDERTSSFVDLKKGPQRSRRSVPVKTNQKTLLTRAARGTSNVQQNVKKTRAHSSKRSNRWDQGTDSSSSNVFSNDTRDTPDDDAMARIERCGTRNLRQEAASSGASAMRPKQKKNVKKVLRQPSSEKPRKTVKRTKVSSNEVGVCCGKNISIRSFFHEVIEKRPGACCDKDSSSPEDADVEKVSQISSDDQISSEDVNSIGSTSTTQCRIPCKGVHTTDSVGSNANAGQNKPTYKCPVSECHNKKSSAQISECQNKKSSAQTSDADYKSAEVSQSRTGIQNRCSTSCSTKVSSSETQPQTNQTGISKDDEFMCKCEGNVSQDSSKVTSAPLSSSTQSESRSSESSCRLCVHEDIYKKAQSTSRTTADKSLEKQGSSLSDKKCTPFPGGKTSTTSPRVERSQSPECRPLTSAKKPWCSVRNDHIEAPIQKGECAIQCPPRKSLSPTLSKTENKCGPLPECWKMENPVTESSTSYRKPSMCRSAENKREAPQSSSHEPVSPAPLKCASPSKCPVKGWKDVSTPAPPISMEKCEQSPCKMNDSVQKPISSTSAKAENECPITLECKKKVDPVSVSSGSIQKPILSTSAKAENECPLIMECKGKVDPVSVSSGSTQEPVSSPQAGYKCSVSPKCQKMTNPSATCSSGSSKTGSASASVSSSPKKSECELRCMKKESTSSVSPKTEKTRHPLTECGKMEKPVSASSTSPGRSSSSRSNMDSETGKKCQPLPKCWKMEKPVFASSSSPGTSTCPSNLKQSNVEDKPDQNIEKSTAPKSPKCQPPPKCWVRGGSTDGGSAEKSTAAPLKIRKCTDWERPVFESPSSASKTSTSSLKTENKCVPCVSMGKPTMSSSSTTSKRSSTSHSEKCQPLPNCGMTKDQTSKPSTTSRASSGSKCVTSSDIKSNLCGQWCLKKGSTGSDPSRSVSTPSPTCTSRHLEKPVSVQPRCGKGSSSESRNGTSTHRPKSQSHKTASSSSSKLCQPSVSQDESVPPTQRNARTMPTTQKSDSSSLPKHCAPQCSTQFHKGQPSSHAQSVSQDGSFPPLQCNSRAMSTTQKSQKSDSSSLPKQCAPQCSTQFHKGQQSPHAQSKASLGTLSPITEPTSHGSNSTSPTNHCQLKCSTQSHHTTTTPAFSKSPSISSSGPSPVECCKLCSSSKESVSSKSPKKMPLQMGTTAPIPHKSTSTGHSECNACLHLRSTPAPKCAHCMQKSLSKTGSTAAEDSTVEKTNKMAPAPCLPCPGAGSKEEPQVAKRVSGAPCSLCPGAGSKEEPQITKRDTGGAPATEPQITKRDTGGAPATSSCSPCKHLLEKHKTSRSEHENDVNRMINEGSPALHNAKEAHRGSPGPSDVTKRAWECNTGKPTPAPHDAKQAHHRTYEGSPGPSDVMKRAWECNTSKPTTIAPQQGSFKTESRSSESEAGETSSGSSSFTDSSSRPVECRREHTSKEKSRGTGLKDTQPDVGSRSGCGKKTFKQAPRMVKKKSAEEPDARGPFHQYAKIVLYRGNRSSQFRQKFKATVCNRRRYPSTDSQERELRGRINYRADPQIPVTSTHAEELRRQHVVHCRERMLEKLNKKRKHNTRFQ